MMKKDSTKGVLLLLVVIVVVALACVGLVEFLAWLSALIDGSIGMNVVAIIYCVISTVGLLVAWLPRMYTWAMRPSKKKWATNLRKAIGAVLIVALTILCVSLIVTSTFPGLNDNPVNKMSAYLLVNSVLTIVGVILSKPYAAMDKVDAEDGAHADVASGNEDKQG